MTDFHKVPLSSFDAVILPGQRLRWPASGTWTAENPVRLDPGAGWLLRLEHRPRGGRFLGGSPIHQELLLELECDPQQLEDGAPVPWTRALFQAGDEAILYRSSQAKGSLTLLSRSDGGLHYHLELTFLDPCVDRGAHGPLDIQGSLVTAFSPQM